MIDFVNTTTCLPVDVKTVTKRLRKIASQSFLDAVTAKRKSVQKSICVLFVGLKDIGRYIDDNSDPCGLYFPHHPDAHKALIYVCPEKILTWCTDILEELKTETVPVSITISKLYPSLLISVIIHELTHFIMDPWAAIDHDCHIPWGNLVENKFNFEIKSPCSPLKNFYDSSKFSQECVKSCLFMEESLAEAVALHQNYSDKGKIKTALESSVKKNKKPQYSAGLKWTNNLDKLLQIAKLWTDFKEICVKPKSPLHWIHGNLNLPLINVFEKLLECENGKLMIEDVQPNFDLTLFNEKDHDKLKYAMTSGSDVDRFWVSANERFHSDIGILKLLLTDNSEYVRHNILLHQSIWDIDIMKIIMGRESQNFNGSKNKDIRIAAVYHQNNNMFIVMLGMNDPDEDVKKAAQKVLKSGKFSIKN